VLAQNWDWLRDMEDWIVILNINDQVLTMTECGMIGKIGFNRHGLGTTINSLHALPDGYVSDAAKEQMYDISGIPIHLIMRHLLNAYKSVAEIEADGIIAKLPVNRNIGIGLLDSRQRGHYVEYNGFGNYDELLLSNTNLSFHTNHFLGNSFSMITEEICSESVGTLRRMQRLKTLYKEKTSDHSTATKRDDVALCKALLTDKHPNRGFPVFRHWVRSKNSKFGVIGSVCAVVMDLNQKVMHITRQKDCNLITEPELIKFDQVRMRTFDELK